MAGAKVLCQHRALLLCLAKMSKVTGLPLWLLSLSFDFKKTCIGRNVHYLVWTQTGGVKQNRSPSF